MNVDDDPGAGKVSRARLLAGSAATFASIAVVRAPARAATFNYKAGDYAPTNHPISVRMVELFATIREETQGRLDVKVFPNGVLGSDTAMVTQLRSGALQFLAVYLPSLQSIAPDCGVAGIGFAFGDAAGWEAAFDGPLGAHLRQQLADRGLYAFERAFNLGMRQVTSGTKPIQTVADFAGFKIRTAPAPIAVDLFTTLGAAPTPLDFTEAYTALQTHIIDGLETPVSVVDSAKFYEVQRYCSMTNHLASINNLIANADAWAALPADIQTIVRRNVNKFALLERRDVALQSAATIDKLRRLGMAFNVPDTESMRKQLAPYYLKWSKVFGPQVWALVEQAAGRKLTS